MEPVVASTETNPILINSGVVAGIIHMEEAGSDEMKNLGN